MSAQPLFVTNAFHNIQIATLCPFNSGMLSVKKGKFEFSHSGCFNPLAVLADSIAWLEYPDWKVKVRWKTLSLPDKQILLKFLQIMRLKNPYIWFSSVPLKGKLWKEVSAHIPEWMPFAYSGRLDYPKDKPHPIPAPPCSASFTWLGHKSSLIEFNMGETLWKCLINPHEADKITSLDKGLFNRIILPIIPKERLLVPDCIVITDDSPDAFDPPTVSFFSFCKPYVFAPPMVTKVLATKSKEATLEGVEGTKKYFIAEKKSLTKVWVSVIDSKTHVFSFPMTTACDHFYHLVVLGSFEGADIKGVKGHCGHILSQFSHIDRLVVPLDPFKSKRKKEQNYLSLMAYAAFYLKPTSIFACGYGSWKLHTGLNGCTSYQAFHIELSKHKLQDSLIPEKYWSSSLY